MLPQRDHTNLFVGLGLGFAVALLCYFLPALTYATWGETAGALGNVVGAIIGAAAAIFAVYFTLARQRAEETNKVVAAITTEVTALTKHVIWSIHRCQDVAAGTAIRRSDGMYIVRNLVTPAVVYPAVADRIGLLPHPQATVNFYMRVSEASAMVESFVKDSRPTAPPIITSHFASKVADCLLTALHLSLPIVAGSRAGSPEFLANIQNTTIDQIGECIREARHVFPDAGIFQGPTRAENEARTKR